LNARNTAQASNIWLSFSIACFTQKQRWKNCGSHGFLILNKSSWNG